MKGMKDKIIAKNKRNVLHQGYGINLAKERATVLHLSVLNHKPFTTHEYSQPHRGPGHRDFLFLQ